MRTVSILILSGLVLAACGRKEEPAPAPEADAVAVEPAGPSEQELRKACQAGLAAIHGQALAAVTVDKVDGPLVTVTWAAPVDGGTLSAECQLDRGLIMWKPLSRPVAEENRWMTQPGDPVVRYMMEGDDITVTQTLADGETVSTTYSLTVVGEGSR